jgi:Ankyrin repeats (3 copies)/Ankyrin repeats (many copies)
METASKTTPKAIKFFFSSRMNVMLPKDFPIWEKLELDSQKILREVDMKKYIQTEVKDRKKLNIERPLLDGQYPTLEDRLVKILTDRAQGMWVDNIITPVTAEPLIVSHYSRFRWAELQLAAFFGPNSRIHHPTEVIHKLDKLEKETGVPKLDEVYAEIYEANTIPEDVCRITATRAFKWMMCAERPLHITELAEAASFDNDGTKDKVVDEEFILKICSNFIIADESRMARFAHLSVREYLEKRKTGDVKEYSSEQAHTQAAVTCLLCLLNHRPISGINDFNFGLPGYSVLYWATHWEMASDNRSGHLGRLYIKFWAKGDVKSPFIDWIKALPQGEKYLGWTQQAKTRLRAAISSPPDPLFAACVWGFSEIIIDLPVITNIPELTVQRGRGLGIASTYGHEAVVRLLLKQGADVKAEDEGGWTALHCAAESGHEAVVRLLLEQGVDVKAKKENGWTALHGAAVCEHEAVVRLLLEQGADDKAEDKSGWTALHYAAESGNKAVVHLLQTFLTYPNSND